MCVYIYYIYIYIYIIYIYIHHTYISVCISVYELVEAPGTGDDELRAGEALDLGWV